MNYSEIQISISNKEFINGNLNLIPNSNSLVIFSHGSGSSRFSKRNQFVANVFNQAKISTLLLDLLTQQEDKIDQITRQFRFDIPLLAERLIIVTKQLKLNKDFSNSKFGYFGSSTGAASALIAAAKLPEDISAVVSRGGRPDLAENYLEKVKAPTLLIVGSLDYEVIELNEFAFSKLNSIKEVSIIPNATHLFEEEGALEKVSILARDWFLDYLK